MENTSTKLNPYLHFEDNCEEAFNFYKSVFNGTLDIKRFESSPMEVPESHKKKVLHAKLTFGDNVIMASDCVPGTKTNKGSNIELSLDFNEPAESQRVFEALSTNGKIIAPLQNQFWGALFGQFTDQFGVSWMVNCNTTS